MQSLFLNICRFIRSVALRWVNLCGSTIIGTIFLWQSAHHQEVPVTACWWILGSCLAIAIFQSWLEQYLKASKLEELSKPKLDVVYKEDGQCNLSGSATNQPHFRVRLFLHGHVLIKHLTATVKAVRKDGQELELREAVRLRFHNAKNFADELEAMNPETDELLDIFRRDTGARLSLAVSRLYNSFDCFLCNEPNHTYEIDVCIGSSTVPKEFTFVIPWTGVFKTTHPYIKPPI